MLELMDRSFQDFETAMPSKPQLVKLSFGIVYRYKEKDIYQAIIQKLARVQSAVRAAYLLLNNGFVQEQAILHRVIDEANEDIIFLVYAITNDTITELHERFLDAFWQEEFDDSGVVIKSNLKRPMIPRKKIQAYISRIDGPELDTCTRHSNARAISKAYSGFVHGASPHIMDMYGGDPPLFHTKGMRNTPRMEQYANDLWNYVYRSFISHIFVAKAIGAKEHVRMLTGFLEKVENNANSAKE